MRHLCTLCLNSRSSLPTAARLASGAVDPGFWSAVIAAAGALTGGGVVSLLRIRGLRRRDDAETDEHRSGSAKLLAEAYGVLVDDLREDLRDARGHITRQDEELRLLREDLRTIVATKDQEIAAVRNELANERTENGRLRDRVATLEAKVIALSPQSGRRATDPPATAAAG